jgi:general secretion pathway protein E
MSREPDLFISTGSGDKETVMWLNDLFLSAAQTGVADIHFEEHGHNCRIRWRLPGGLSTYDTITGNQVRIVDDKIRSRAQLPTGDRKSSHDGRIQLRYSLPVKRKLDIRVSIQPCVNGQSIVCRVHDESSAILDINLIEMQPAVRYFIDQIIDEPTGLFLVTGPTGSGKTTTLYAILNELNTPDKKISTIENPVEITLPGLNQTDIDDQHNTFPQALRATLRQDPDVILVGEIRDTETAQIAIQAAMTGHLVLATLHTNDSIQTIARLLDLGVDVHNLAASLRAVTAQRLVRRLEGELKMSPPSAVERAWLKTHSIFHEGEKYAAISEDSVMNGRLPVIEMVVVDEVFRKAMVEGNRAMYAAASRQPQYETLAQAGVRLAAQGKTTLDEVRKIAGNEPIGDISRRFGQELIEAGIITPAQRDQAVSEQISMRSKGTVKRLGDVLVMLGFCTLEDVEKVFFEARGGES